MSRLIRYCATGGLIGAFIGSLIGGFVDSHVSTFSILYVAFFLVLAAISWIDHWVNTLAESRKCDCDCGCDDDDCKSESSTEPNTEGEVRKPNDMSGMHG